MVGSQRKRGATSNAATELGDDISHLREDPQSRKSDAEPITNNYPETHGAGATSISKEEPGSDAREEKTKARETGSKRKPPRNQADDVAGPITTDESKSTEVEDASVKKKTEEKQSRVDKELEVAEEQTAGIKTIVDDYRKLTRETFRGEDLKKITEMARQKIKRDRSANEAEKREALDTIHAISAERFEILTALEEKDKDLLSDIVRSFRDFTGDAEAIEQAFNKALEEINLLLMPTVSEKAAARAEISELLEEKKAKPNTSGLGNFNTVDFEKIVIIPDVHGDAEYFIHSLWIAFMQVEPAENTVKFEQFDGALREAAASVEFPKGKPTVLPESPLSMKGERIAIVQLGDVMDRGPHSWLSYKLLASLDHVIGWKKVQLFGNHELLIYMLPGIFDLRYNQYPTDISNEEARIQFAPGGPLMKYLINNNLLMARFGAPIDSSKRYVVDPKTKADTLFVHAGLELNWVREIMRDERIKKWEDFVDSVNRAKRRDFEEKPDLTYEFAMLDPNSPVFTRTIPEAKTPDQLNKGCEDLEFVLEFLQVSRIIVGHTPESRSVRSYCHSKFIVSDVAMSRGFLSAGSHPFAMVMSLDHGGADVAALQYYHGVPGGVNRAPDVTTLIKN